MTLSFLTCPLTNLLRARIAALAVTLIVESLRAYLEKYGHQAGIAARLETELHAEPALAPRAEVQVIRVIQEALTNVRKHAGATRAVVRLASDGEQVTLTIEDDGRGCDLGRALMQADSGYGLHTMRERMELVGEIQREIGQLAEVGSSLSTVTFGRDSYTAPITPSVRRSNFRCMKLPPMIEALVSIAATMKTTNAVRGSAAESAHSITTVKTRRTVQVIQ